MILRLMVLVLLTSASGCLWTPKPYANDPLILQRRANLGDPDRRATLVPFVEPEAPPPPAELVP
ncbi:MAG: hypothetical protein U0798_00350 [Gemmataceae bacterium]